MTKIFNNFITELFDKFNEFTELSSLEIFYISLPVVLLIVYSFKQLRITKNTQNYYIESNVIIRQTETLGAKTVIKEIERREKFERQNIQQAYVPNIFKWLIKLFIFCTIYWFINNYVL